tara:strand:+ start:28 stop:273 length:246 start_codon:yes stop_codon:yes gene_type:complete
MKRKQANILLVGFLFMSGCQKLNQMGHSIYLESQAAFQSLENIVLSPVRATDDFIEEEITGPPLDPNQGTFEGWKKIDKHT